MPTLKATTTAPERGIRLASLALALVLSLGCVAHPSAPPKAPSAASSGATPKALAQPAPAPAKEDTGPASLDTPTATGDTDDAHKKVENDTGVPYTDAASARKFVDRVYGPVGARTWEKVRERLARGDLDHPKGKALEGHCDLRSFPWQEHPELLGLEWFPRVKNAAEAQQLAERSYALLAPQTADMNGDKRHDFAMVTATHFIPLSDGGVYAWGEMTSFTLEGCVVVPQQVLIVAGGAPKRQ